jgi:hypothetical protein
MSDTTYNRITNASLWIAALSAEAFDHLPQSHVLCGLVALACVVVSTVTWWRFGGPSTRRRINPMSLKTRFLLALLRLIRSIQDWQYRRYVERSVSRAEKLLEVNRWMHHQEQGNHQEQQGK